MITLISPLSFSNLFKNLSIMIPSISIQNNVTEVKDLIISLNCKIVVENNYIKGRKLYFTSLKHISCYGEQLNFKKLNLSYM